MITNNKTSKIKRILYILLLPLTFVMIQSFSNGKNSNNPPSIKPVKGGEISLEFGYSGKHPITNKPFTHKGIDIRIEEGTTVMATAPGVVIEATEKDNWGKIVIIQHDKSYETWYAHLKSISVKKGDKVISGQEIGLSGNTGYSTGPHLHYEVRKNGERVNPEDYFN